MLVIESRAFPILGKYFTTEVFLQPLFLVMQLRLAWNSCSTSRRGKAALNGSGQVACERQGFVWSLTLHMELGTGVVDSQFCLGGSSALQGF